MTTITPNNVANPNYIASARPPEVALKRHR